MRTETPNAPRPGSASLPAGEGCLAALRDRGVAFVPLSELQGVDNPIEVQGKLGGVEFWANDRRPLEMDCLLALTLDRLRPVFERHRLTRIRYSGAYSYRTQKSGRPSRHALGLAIDIHELDFGAESFSIERDFVKKADCRELLPATNSVACDLRRTGLFQEFLSPDDNYDHRDHLHLSVPGLTFAGSAK